jgi:hypothetical protein
LSLEADGWHTEPSHVPLVAAAWLVEAVAEVALIAVMKRG